MSRYVAIPQGAFVHDDGLGCGPSVTADVCQEMDKSPVKTGLLDASGVPLYRMPETVPFGFVLRGK